MDIVIKTVDTQKLSAYKRLLVEEYWKISDDEFPVLIETILEDINGDGTVDTQDILSIFDFIVQGKPVNATTIEDVNKDGLVDTQDVLSVYDYIIKH